MAPERPIQVTRAVALMWASLAIGYALAIPAWEPVPAELKEYEPFVWVPMLVGFAIPAGLILFVSRQRNWARITLLLFTVAGLAVWVAFWNEDPPEPLWLKVSNILTSVLDLIALYWLFSKPASQWFASRKVQRSAV
jgi:hypothetical protein